MQNKRGILKRRFAEICDKSNKIQTTGIGLGLRKIFQGYPVEFHLLRPHCYLFIFLKNALLLNHQCHEKNDVLVFRPYHDTEIYSSFSRIKS
jgi:hypothetical protein